MSVSFSAVFESEAPPLGTLGSDHTVLSRLKDELDHLAEDQGLTPLSAFESYDPSEVAGLFDGADLEEFPEPQWFDPGTGLAAVNAIASYLRSAVEAVPEQARVLEELESIVADLEVAQRAGVRFRFAVVM